jgi:hypothetical protein
MILNFTERMIERLKILERVAKDGDKKQRDHLLDILPEISQEHAKFRKKYYTNSAFGPREEEKVVKVATADRGEVQRDPIQTKQTSTLHISAPASREASKEFSMASCIKLQDAKGGAIYHPEHSLQDEPASPEDQVNNGATAKTLTAPLLDSMLPDGHAARINFETR